MVIEEVSEEGLLGLVAGFMIIFVLCGFLLHCLDTGFEKIESYINKFYPAYTTRAEKTLRVKAEKERIYTSLKKWTDKWMRENRSHLENTEYSQPIENLVHFYSKDNDIRAKDIWAIVSIPCNEKSVPGDSLFVFREQQFILHSQDNGKNWEIKWKRPHDASLCGVELKGIKVIDKQRVCVILYVTGDPHEFYKLYFAMLYTIDGGKNWQFENK